MFRINTVAKIFSSTQKYQILCLVNKNQDIYHLKQDDIACGEINALIPPNDTRNY